MTGTYMLHFPYRGSGPALIDLMGGKMRPDVRQPAVGAAADQGRQAEGARGHQRASARAALPDVPTIAEAGPALKGFEASSWFGLLAPAGTPADIVDRVQQETAKALATPALKERLLSQGAIPSGITPARVRRASSTPRRRSGRRW